MKPAAMTNRCRIGDYRIRALHRRLARRFYKADDFYVPDEPAQDVRDAFERAPKGKTGRPRPSPT